MSEGSIPDEEWERFLREAAAGTPGAPEEPSARARMVTRRLAAETGPPPGWRTRTPARRRRGKGWYVLGLLVAIGVLVVALLPGRLTGWWGNGDPDTGSAPLAAETARPDQPPPTEAAPGLPTADDPFRGSPARLWSDGATGLGLPVARATGWMTKAEVARALDRSRAFLVASSLDPGVLRGERPAKAIAAVNPQQRDVQDYLAATFTAPTRENSPLLLFSRFDSTKVRLAGDVVKTRGLITYREGERGAVEVRTDVTYVYPLVRAASGSDEVARTIVRREVVMSWDDPAKVYIEPGTFSLVSYKVDSANGGCDTSAGYFTPAFRAERAVTGQGEGPEADPYDRSTPMDTRMRDADGVGCGKASRL
ncbi:hypothetical protein OG349_10680 [Streptomyces sp. NBC_01317]|uniref:hypothetical protein n=1 Tax=Streptomyces sp. NBC_01317 TaxID=2903822 RepID=UPI002E0FF602|nr:hypothetical protein OG349_10680 [Streptomyces sp. NBC_01317]